jgi:hypothetical protein
MAVAGAALPALRQSGIPVKPTYPGYIYVPAFPIYSDPMISLDEIRTRRFDVFVKPLMVHMDYQKLARMAIKVEPLSPGAKEDYAKAWLSN